MIVGLGIDVVALDRFEDALTRSPGLVPRIFTARERDLGRSRLGHSSLAARFAAKEALAKALGAPAGLSWKDAEVTTTHGGAPSLTVTGTVAARAAELGITRFHLSMSHDAGLASAVVVAEGEG